MTPNGAIVVDTNINSQAKLSLIAPHDIITIARNVSTYHLIACTVETHSQPSAASPAPNVSLPPAS